MCRRINKLKTSKKKDNLSNKKKRSYCFIYRNCLIYKCEKMISIKLKSVIKLLMKRLQLFLLYQTSHLFLLSFLFFFFFFAAVKIIFCIEKKKESKVFYKNFYVYNIFHSFFSVLYPYKSTEKPQIYIYFFFLLATIIVIIKTANCIHSINIHKIKQTKSKKKKKNNNNNKTECRKEKKKKI